MEYPINHARLKVIGVGNGGGNALNALIGQQSHGMEYIAVNTDSAVLEQSLAPQKILIGAACTGGTGARADLQVDRQAALEDSERIKEAVADADMVVIIAGMGGGAGTGAAPVIARAAR